MKNLFYFLVGLTFVLWAFLAEFNTAQLQLIVTSIGILVAWLGFSRVNESVRREVVSSLFTQNAHVRGLIAADSRFRKYFFDDIEILPDHPDYDEVRTIAEIYLNYLEHLAIEQKSLKMNEEETWNSTVEDMLFRSPIMREVIQIDGKWYAKQLQTAAKKMIEKSKKEPYKKRTLKNMKS